jgi:hypothetical protein
VTYEKPVLVELVNAIHAVQASMQKMAPPTDLSGLTTVAAYECDEGGTPAPSALVLIASDS